MRGTAINKKAKFFNWNWEFNRDYYENSLKALNTAFTKVAGYRSWREFDPGESYPVDQRYSCLPSLTKKDIREHSLLEMLPEGADLEGALARQEIGLVTTSGTTEEKIINIWNQSWWDASERSSWKYNSSLHRIADGEHSEAILVNPRNVGVISDEADLPMEKRRLSRFLYLNEKTDPTAWSPDLMDRMIEELNTFQPAVLEASPSYLARLCRYISSGKKTVFQPGIIIFTYEYPSVFHYRQVRGVFHVPVASSYGTTETGYVFMQCEKGKFHQNSEFCRVDFQPLKKEHGGPLLGRILVTPFNNPWNNFLRFDTGDLVHIEESGKCACGRKSGIILSTVNGRQVNLTLSSTGRLITLFELDKALAELEDIETYQLIQEKTGKYRFRVVSKSADRKELENRIVKKLKMVYGSESDIDIIHEKDIAPEISGKYSLAKTGFLLNLEDYLDEEYLNKQIRAE